MIESNEKTDKRIINNYSQSSFGNNSLNITLATSEGKSSPVPPEKFRIWTLKVKKSPLLKYPKGHLLKLDKNQEQQVYYHIMTPFIENGSWEQGSRCLKVVKNHMPL